MRRTFAAAVVVAACSVPAGSAHAGVLNFCSAATSPYCFGDTSLTYSDNTAEGEANNVLVTRSGDTLVFRDSGATVTQGSGSNCAAAGDGHTFTCPAPANASQTSILIIGGAGNDTIQNDVVGTSDQVFATSTLSGAAGNDVITGPDGARFTSDTEFGGTGDDIMHSRAGSDSLSDFDFFQDTDSQASPQGGSNHFFGGDGNDFLFGGNGVDELRGERGDDTFQGDQFDVVNTPSRPGRAAVVVSQRSNDTIDGADGFDTVQDELAPTLDANGNRTDPPPTTPGVKWTLNDAATTRLATTTGNGLIGTTENDTFISIEDALGTEGADQITGSATSNVIRGAGGNDTLTGGAGPDSLFGDDGDDTLNAADGETDRVSCGENAGDKANIDQVDVTSGCPAVGAGTTITNVANPSIDRTAPVITVTVKKKIKAKVLRKKGITCGIRSKDTVANRAICTLTAKVRSVTIATAGEVILAEKRKTFTGKTSVKLKIAKKLQKAIKKGRKLRMLVQVTDQAGNTTAKRVNITVI